jgi:hypothetical protein
MSRRIAPTHPGDTAMPKARRGASRNAPARAPRRMPKWGWYAFLFFSFLSAASAFKFVPAGLMQGFFPSLGEGLPAAWWAFVDEGIRRGADHVAHHIENVGGTLAVHMLFGGLAVLLIPLQVSRMWRRANGASMSIWAGRWCLW